MHLPKPFGLRAQGRAAADSTFQATSPVPDRLRRRLGDRLVRAGRVWRAEPAQMGTVTRAQAFLLSSAAIVAIIGALIGVVSESRQRERPPLNELKKVGDPGR